MKNSFNRLFLPSTFAALSISIACADSVWDPTGATSVGTGSDGAGIWLGTGLWYDTVGNTNFTWSNTTNANIVANFGASATGVAGLIDLTGGVSAGGLQFNAVNLAGTTNTVNNGAYSFGSGTLTLATGSTIDFRTGSTTTSTEDRVTFVNGSVIAGSNINITNTNGGNIGVSLIRLQGANTWTGTLTLTGNSQGGLFTEITTPSAINTLTKISGGTNTSLVINTASSVTVPTIEINGTGSSSRGAIRFDNSQTMTSAIVLTGDSSIATSDGTSSVVQLTGAISGNHGLTLDSAATSQGRFIFRNANNTFTTLTVNKGTAQIGLSGTGTSGTGLTTVNGATAAVSGTGTIKGGLTVTNGSVGGAVRPGDTGGTNAGVLNVIGDVTFNPTAAINALQMNLVASPTTSDRLNITTGGLAINNFTNINVTQDAAFATPTVGQSWQLINWSGSLTNNGFNVGQNLRSGADSAMNEGNLNLFDLSTYGYLWDINLGPNSLVVTIVIPEASTALLGMVGAASLLIRRRRHA